MMMKGSILKKIILLISANGFSLFFPFLFAPILSRIFTPVEYGFFGFFTTIVSLITLISSFRYEFTLFKFSTQKEIINSYFSVRFVLYITFIVLFLLVSVIYSLSDINVYYLLIPVSVFLGGYIQLNLILANVLEKYKVISVNSIFRSITVNLLMLFFGFLNESFISLVLAFILTQLLQALYFYFYFKKYIKSFSMSLFDINKFLKFHFNEMKFSVFSTILNSLSIQMPILFMKKYFSYTDVGAYFQSDRLITVPVKLVSRSMSTIYIKEISSYKGNSEKVNNLTLEFIKKMILIGVVPFSFIFIFGNQIFTFILGENWSEVGFFASVLAPFIYVNFICIPFTNLFEIYKKQKIFLKFNTSLLLLRILALFVGLYFDSLKIGIITFSVFSIVNYLIMLSTLFRVIKLPQIKVFFQLIFFFILNCLFFYLIKIII